MEIEGMWFLPLKKTFPNEAQTVFSKHTSDFFPALSGKNNFPPKKEGWREV